jgi:hypothetical protein
VRMRDNDCGSTCHYCQPEYLPRMTKDCIHSANGHQVVTFYASACVEDEYHQTFTFRIQRRSRLHLIVLRLYGGFASPILFIHGLGANLSTRMIESDLAAAGCSIVCRTAKLPIF